MPESEVDDDLYFIIILYIFYMCVSSITIYLDPAEIVKLSLALGRPQITATLGSIVRYCPKRTVVTILVLRE